MSYNPDKHRGDRYVLPAQEEEEEEEEREEEEREEGELAGGRAEGPRRTNREHRDKFLNYFAKKGQ